MGNQQKSNQHLNSKAMKTQIIITIEQHGEKTIGRFFVYENGKQTNKCIIENTPPEKEKPKGKEWSFTEEYREKLKNIFKK